MVVLETMSSTVSMVNGGACALHGFTGATLRLEWYAGNLDTALKVSSPLSSSSLHQTPITAAG